MGLASPRRHMAIGTTPRRPPCLENFWRAGNSRDTKITKTSYTMGLRGANDYRRWLRTAAGGEHGLNSKKSLPPSAKSWPKRSIPTSPRCRNCGVSTRRCRIFTTRGMRVPDDVTLLWAEDNWGNVRRLPTARRAQAFRRRGHLLSLRLPRRPAQLSVAEHQPISKIWEQMSLAKQYGADRIWIVNSNT